ncbi:MAG: SDR family oxidoreductase [Actinomycetota bacterium]|nr:SDR family oxidoreductase [Actinomycetota bacterium]
MGRLEGKVALITGAASGMGRVAASVFAGEGARVVAADVDRAGAEETVGRVVAAGGQGASVAADVTDGSQVEAMVGFAVSTYGGLHVLYNNAGVRLEGDAGTVETDEVTWDAVLDVNLKGVWLGCKHAIPAMAASGGGSIVNVASMVALVGSATAEIAYTASKGGVLALTREVAVEQARAGIRCNAIAPGPIQTPLLAGLLADPRWRARRLVHIPMGRAGRDVEVVNAALFLASDESSYVTGATLSVDGGIAAAYVTPE